MMMRFAIVTIDRYMGIFQAFMDAGWQPIKLFTGASKNEFDTQQQVIAEAERRSLDIQLSRITENDIMALRAQGCDALVVAGYSWKIPDTRQILPYAVNFHPSPLPIGRGPYPMPQVILEDRDNWAISCHKLVPELDAGDILSSESFPLSDGECHESLDLKIQIAGTRLAKKIADNFHTYWDQAIPQNNATYWKKASEDDRLIDFAQPIDLVLRHIRAYGMTESFAKFGESILVVKRAIGWQEHHSFPPGQIVHLNQRKLVVAVQDGFVGFLDIAPLSSSIFRT